jgi:lincosamide and streptogramin A transport system ATP-binding/permease protein
MPTISLNDLEFHYHSPFTPVFDGLSIAIDTEWRTAVVGRNGRGKTTLLRLLHGELRPVRGSVSVPVETCRFPSSVPDPGRPTIEVIRESVAPFALWERRMAELLAIGDEPAIAGYGDILERYQGAHGYQIDALIERESFEIGMEHATLARPFTTLSGGEQTRALIVALFLKPGAFPLIDEPTNHLDMQGRQMLGEYLARKSGFIVVSHDRHFLDTCVDHILSINRGDVRINRGSFSGWQEQMEIEEEHERRRNENLKREIADLESEAGRRRSWSAAKERGKDSAADSGFVSAVAARQMRRALQAERRIEKKIEEKKSLLGNLEQARALKLWTEGRSPELLLTLDDVKLAIGGRTILDGFSLAVRKGERVAIVGPNGCGKTTLLRAIAGELAPLSGIIHLPKHLGIGRGYQIPLWDAGSLREHLREAGLDETAFRNIMGAFGVSGDLFERPLESFSQGERKKVDLCRSFVGSAHLWIWDEPMNYIDMMSREQIEEAILRHEPTMLFVEHDRRFVERVATRVVELPARRAPAPRERGAEVESTV